MTESILTLQDYEARALQTDQTRKPGKSPDLPYLGLFGESGSLTSEIKKKQRDPNSYIGYQETVVEELGDVLWYLTIIANRTGTSLAIIAGNLTRDGSFLGLQPQHALPLNHPTPEFERTLLQLGAATGALLNSHISGGAASEIHDLLTKIFGALVNHQRHFRPPIRIMNIAQVQLERGKTLCAD
jgi:NTP pyrophosphatase (non-canonical NTP hydrolase)